MATAGGKAVIGPDLFVEGEIRNAAEIEVMGAVHGSLAADRVVVHPGGRVVGALDATAVEVHGLLEGRIRVRQLISIGATGVVAGDVRYGQLALAPGGDLAAEVRNLPPEIGGDFEVVVRRGRSVRITPTDLMATDAEDGAGALTFRVSGADSGHLARTPAPAMAVETFTQADIAAGGVVFVHDGGPGDHAGFDVVVSDSAGATAGSARRVAVVVI